jgi:DNA-binding beta-propeller fold protein YncE
MVLVVALLAFPAAASAGVYVPNRSGGTVSQFDVGALGALSPMAPPTVPVGSTAPAGTVPFGVAISPDARSVYITNRTGGTVSQFDVGASGALSPKTPPTVSAGNGPTGVAASPDGRSVYVTNGVDDTVSQFDVGASGALSPKTPATVRAGVEPHAVAVNPDGRSVYVITSGTVAQFDVGASGALTAKASRTVLTGTDPTAVAVSPDGRSVYVPNLVDGTVSQFDVGASGALRPKTAPAVPASRPFGVAVSPDGRSVYVTDLGLAGPGTVSQFDVGASGALSPKSSPTVPAGEAADAVAVSPDGRSVYVTNALDDTVSQFDVGASGALSPKTPPTVPAGGTPDAVAVRPDQGPRAAFDVAVAAAGGATRFDGTASSDSDGSVARFDWNFGDGTSAADAGPTPVHTYAPGAYAVTLRVTDDAGCSTRLVFTGQTAGCVGGPAKLGLARATLDRRAQTVSVLAPITRRASGRARITLQAAGRTRTYTTRVDGARGRIRLVRRVTRSQARAASGLLTIRYLGDADTRSQTLRVRVGVHPARLSAFRPKLDARGVLRSSGRVTRGARGSVEVRLRYVDVGSGRTVTVVRRARIRGRRWRLRSALPAALRAQLHRRCGTRR